MTRDMKEPAATAAGWTIASQWDGSLLQAVRDRLPGHDVHELPRSHPFDGGLTGAQVLLARPLSPAERGAPPPPGWPFGLRWVQLVSVGLDFYPDWLLHTPGLPVSTAHGTSSQTIADFVLAHLLRVQLRLDARRAQSAGQWRFTTAPALAGARVGLVGFGGIGCAVAQRALALGCAVRAVRRRPAPLDVAGVEPARDAAELAAWADHLVLAAPGTEDTRHLVNAALLRQARPGLHLINVARGSLLDAEALREALEAGRVGWASLDVTEPEPLPAGHWLYTHPQVWLTPHTSAISPQVQQALADKVARGLDRLAAGAPPDDLIGG